MAGYKLTFDGSLVERRDVAQVTSVGNLSDLTVVQFAPSNWETPSVGDPYAGGLGVMPVIEYLTTTPIPAGYTNYNSKGNSGSGVVDITSYSGGIAYFNCQQNNGAPFGSHNAGIANFAYPTSLTGNYDFSIRVQGISASWRALSIYRAVEGTNGAGRHSSNSRQLIQLLTQASGFPAGFQIFNWNLTLTALEYITIELAGQSTQVTPSTLYAVDYIRASQTTGGAVSITPSTFTNGVVPTGGIATIASPSTIIDGQASFAGVPKLFGAKVVHDASDVLSAKYLPPATSIQDAESKLSKSKYITATATSISVESEGLGGAEKLGAGKTSIVVENIPATVEN